jgi:mannosyltransferase
MSATDTDTRFHVRYLAVAVALLVAVTWIRQASDSLWLDELGTAWVIKDGAADAIVRAWEYHGQSPAYYLFVWLLTRVAGRSELVLRLPSIVAVAIGSWVLWRIVRRLVSDEAARLAVLGFLSITIVAAAATDARPYAVAVLFLLASVDASVRWLDEGRTRHALFFILFAIATVWVHYLVGLALVALFTYGIARRDHAAVPIGRQLTAWVVVLVGVAPLAPQLLSLYERRASLSVPYDGSIGDLLMVLVPAVLAGGAVIGILVARAQGPVSIRSTAGRTGSLLLFSTWLLFPPTVLFMVSIFGGASLYSARYYVSAAPAAAALFGWGISMIDPAAARRSIVVVTAALAVLASGGVLNHGEDWREAAAAERAAADDGTVVFIHPAFVESAQIDWLTDPVRVDYLLSPSEYYPFEGTLIPLPYQLDNPEAVRYLDEVTGRVVADTDRFLFLTRYPFVPFLQWWEGRLGPDGWRSRTVGMFGTLQLIEFTRDGVEPPPS